MRPTNVLEMMKEWKNIPDSDEESTEDPKNMLSNQGKLEGYLLDIPSKDVQAVSSASEEEEVKQVGRTNKTNRKNSCFISPTLSFLLLVCNEGPT